jgi:hypothetical protein
VSKTDFVPDSSLVTFSSEHQIKLASLPLVAKYWLFKGREQACCYSKNMISWGLDRYRIKYAEFQAPVPSQKRTFHPWVITDLKIFRIGFLWATGSSEYRNRLHTVADEFRREADCDEIFVPLIETNSNEVSEFIFYFQK